MYFSEAVVGDKVWDYVYGDGVITDIADNYIAVVDANETAKRFYTLDGRYGKDDANQRLFYYADRPIITPSFNTDETKDCERYAKLKGFDKTNDKKQLIDILDKYLHDNSQGIAYKFVELLNNV